MYMYINLLSHSVLRFHSYMTLFNLLKFIMVNTEVNLSITGTPTILSHNCGLSNRSLILTRFCHGIKKQIDTSVYIVTCPHSKLSQYNFKISRGESSYMYEHVLRDFVKKRISTL